MPLYLLETVKNAKIEPGWEATDARPACRIIRDSILDSIFDRSVPDNDDPALSREGMLKALAEGATIVIQAYMDKDTMTFGISQLGGRS